MEASVYKFLSSNVDYSQDKPVEGLSLLGILGYSVGFAGLFTFFRLSHSVFPGFFSFLLMSALILMSEMATVGIMHMFLSLSEKKGNAANIFYLFGCSFGLFSLALPAGIIYSFSPSWACIALFAICIVMFVARIRLIMKAYSDTSAGRSIMAILLPGIILHAMTYISLLYCIINTVWIALQGNV